MKHTTLKVGELYAVRNDNWQAYLLLSTDVHEELGRSRAGISYSPAPGQRPHRDQSRAWGYDRRDYGYLALAGKPERLAAVEPAAYLAALVAGTLEPDQTPDGVSIKLITSLASIEGPYDKVTAERQQQRAAREQREVASWSRYNETIDALTAALGARPLQRTSAAPHEVTLSVDQARRLADEVIRLRAQELRY